MDRVDRVDKVLSIDPHPSCTSMRPRGDALDAETLYGVCAHRLSPPADIMGLILKGN